MFEGSRFFNRRIKRSYYHYFYRDNGMKVGDQVVTVSGKDTPRHGNTAYPRPSKPDQIALIVDNLESWVIVNIREFEPLCTTMPEWKKAGKGYIPQMTDGGKVEMVEVSDSMFVKFWQHFDPSNIISFVEGKAIPMLMKGKEDKWANLVLPICLGIICITIIIVVLQLGR